MKALKNFLVMALAMLVLVVSASAATSLTLTATPSTVTVNEGTEVSISLTAASGIAPYAYQITGTDIPGVSTGAMTSNLFAWIPEYTEAGVYFIKFKATDESPELNVAITVNDYQPLTMDANVLIGGPTQQRSNPHAEDDSRKTVYAEKVFKIHNDGDLDVVVSLATTAASEYDVTLTPATGTVAANSDLTVTVKGFVPKDLPSFFPTRSDYNDRRNLLGELQVATTVSGVSAIKTNLYMEAENLLVAKKLYVSVDGDENKVSDLEEIDDVKPDSDVEIRVIAENKYDNNDNEDLEMNDIVFNVNVDDSDLDIDEDLDFEDLGAEDTSEETISFQMDRSEVTESNYYMYVVLSGEDENGAVMGEKYTIELMVERKSHEILVTDVTISPSDLTCKETATLRFDLANIGKKNEDEVSFKVDSPILGLSIVEYDIELDTSDDMTKTIQIPLKNVKPGDYDIQITSYYNRDDVSSEEIATLHVKACGTTAPVVTPVTPVVTPVTGNTVVQPPVTIVPELESFNDFQNSTLYTVLLGGLVLVLAIALIVLLVKFVF